MSDSQLNPWSDRPDAPNIPYDLYSAEKATFAGNIVCSILYGTPKTPSPVYLSVCAHPVCPVGSRDRHHGILSMYGLFDPEHRRGKSIKWGLVSYTVVMFSILTVITAMSFNIFSITFIDNRQFSGVEGLIPPGPLGYSRSIAPMAIAFLPDAMTVFNNWLADGLGQFSVRSCIHSPRCLIPAPPSPALSLLRPLLEEPLGHRVPLPHVPRLYRCAFEFSTGRR